MSVDSIKASGEVYRFISLQCRGRSSGRRILEWYDCSLNCEIQAKSTSIAVNALSFLPNNAVAQRAAAIINDCSRAIHEPMLYHKLSKGCLYMGIVGLATIFVDRKIGLNILAISIIAFAIIRARKEHNQHKASELYGQAMREGYGFLTGRYIYDKEYISNLPVYKNVQDFQRDLFSRG